MNRTDRFVAFMTGAFIAYAAIEYITAERERLRTWYGEWSRRFREHPGSRDVLRRLWIDSEMAEPATPIVEDEPDGG